MQQSKEPTTGRHGRVAHQRKGEMAVSSSHIDALSRIDPGRRAIPEIARFPQRLSQPEFLATAYPLMLLSRRIEERLLELFQKSYVKGTVTMGDGNEATAVGFAMPLRPGATWSRSCTVTSPLICYWAPRRSACFASIWPTPRVPRTAAKGTAITATPPGDASP